MSNSSFNKRCLAYSIDSCIAGVVSYAISFLFGDGWFSIVLSIMVVDESGKGIDFATAAKRYFGKIL